MNDRRLTFDQATQLTGDIRDHVNAATLSLERVIQLLATARAQQVYEVLGYPTFPAYVEGELGPALRRLGEIQRRELIRVLADSDLGTRSIATTVGTSQSTVSRTLRAESYDSPVVTGRDGKSYPRVRDRADVHRTASPGERSRSVPEPRRSNFVDAYATALQELRRVLERLEKLHADDRFPRHRGHLMNRAGFLEEVSDRLLELPAQLRGSQPPMTAAPQGREGDDSHE